MRQIIRSKQDGSWNFVIDHFCTFGQGTVWLEVVSTLYDGNDSPYSKQDMVVELMRNDGIVFAEYDLIGAEIMFRHFEADENKLQWTIYCDQIIETNYRIPPLGTKNSKNNFISRVAIFFGLK